MDVIKELDESYTAKEIKHVDDSENLEVESSPVVKLINYLLEEAYLEKASDIHIEPLYDYLRIRSRLDGDLEEIMRISKVHHSAIVARIKIMAKMDITEKRIPQEGRININIDSRLIDLRVSILPTINGEKIVLRILDKNNFKFTKKDIGLSKKEDELLGKILKKTSGIILVSGSSGSGKTTTLYSLIKELNRVNKNIVTIEDPVEYRIEGIIQVPVNEKKNLNFNLGLKSILRQDPDIVMIGEIRDEDTAKTAIRAANTGHLVLATIHTNDGLQTINRLREMGVEDYLIKSSVLCIISQRLIKRLCPICKEKYFASEDEKRYLGKKDDNIILYRNRGCSKCNNGYKKRSLINEMLIMNDELKEVLGSELSLNQIKKDIFKNKKSIYDKALSLTIRGETSMEELYKIDLEDK